MHLNQKDTRHDDDRSPAHEIQGSSRTPLRIESSFGHLDHKIGHESFRCIDYFLDGSHQRLCGKIFLAHFILNNFMEVASPNATRETFVKITDSRADDVDYVETSGQVIRRIREKENDDHLSDCGIFLFVSLQATSLEDVSIGEGQWIRAEGQIFLFNAELAEP